MLRLDKYFFPKVSFTANPGFIKDEEDLQPSMAVDVKGGYGFQGEKIEAVLEIVVRQENDHDQIPYFIDLMAVGQFTMIDGKEPDNKFMATNSLAILYGAAREFVLSVTSRGPWQPLMLPTYYFTPDGLSLAEKKEEPEKE